MPRAEFACDRCDERRGVHPTPDGRRCDRCLTEEGFPAEEASGERVLEHALVADGGREHCAECDAPIPDEIEPGTGVYCPRCGTGQHVADGGAVDVEADDPLATFQAALLPGWCWEVFDVEERDAEVVTDPDGETARTTIYRGRVKSPNTLGRWEHGTFTAAELERAGAFRTDEDTGRWP